MTSISTGHSKGVIPKSGPACPHHARPTKYTPEMGVWACQTVGCKFRIWPDHEFNGKPLVGKGELQVIREGRNIFIRATSNNVLLNVTELVTYAQRVHRNASPISAEVDAIEIHLNCPNVMEVENSQPVKKLAGT